MMNVPALLTRWKTDATIGANICEWRDLPARPAQTETFPDDLHLDLALALRSEGIRSLYTHQAETWRQIHSGKNVVIVTGTASGKTLAYNLPVIDHLLKDTQARALYLFPTKALAQDQLTGLKALADRLSSDHQLPAAVYDGDTPQKDRSAIRQRARLVITNPDMLHMGILPHHTAWAAVFQNLRFIVIDEIHAYRGVFGSHFANVLRRLKRICSHYGANPRLLLTSATIANPAELAETLVEEPFECITRDGSARGSKSFLFYNPPVVDRDLGLRRSALHESVRLAEDLLAHDIQSILFARSRRSVEIVLTYLREKADPVSVRGYRSGYLPEQRREVEAGLRQGVVKSVVATNALELGIDIGGMGAVVMIGYPGTIAAAWQQAGRAGRSDQASLAVMVATANPLDQYLARFPQYFFGQSPEQALINPDNLLILLEHIRCAAFELPFQPGESFGKLPVSRLQEILDFLVEQGQLHRSGERYFWMADQYPAQEVSLRSASADRVVLQSLVNGTPRTIGEVDRASAVWMVHPGAVYLHEAQTYLVNQLDLEQGLAWLQRTDTDYYTEPRLETQVNLIEKLQQAEVPGGSIALGELQVTSQLVGYRKVRWMTHETLGVGEVSLPPSELLTTGYWVTISPETVVRLQELGLWNSGPVDYGPNWGKVRNEVRLRDGYRCQACGAAERGREHDVHHRTPFRAFKLVPGIPVFELANRQENLVTLCRDCHRRAETAVRIRSGLSGLAYSLGHLAPLLLMCDRGDLGVHADPQSALAEGQPALVLYDQVPAGIGLSTRLFELHADLVQRARQLVQACECDDGCPSCVGPGGEAGAGGKPETLALLDVLTDSAPYAITL